MAAVPFNFPKIMQTQHHDEKLLKALSDYHVIHLDDSKFSEKLTWCLEHCQNKFRDLSNNHGRDWYFENKQDATLFAMKWA